MFTKTTQLNWTNTKKKYKFEKTSFPTWNPHNWVHSRTRRSKFQQFYYILVCQWSFMLLNQSTHSSYNSVYFVKIINEIHSQLFIPYKHEIRTILVTYFQTNWTNHIIYIVECDEPTLNEKKYGLVRTWNYWDDPPRVPDGFLSSLYQLVTDSFSRTTEDLLHWKLNTLYSFHVKGKPGKANQTQTLLSLFQTKQLRTLLSSQYMHEINTK